MRKAVAIVIVLAGAVWAADATHPAEAPAQGAPNEPQTIVHVYDVGALVQRVGQYPLDPTLVPAMPPPEDDRGVEGNSPPQGPETENDNVDSICRLIASTIAPDTWRDAGGTEGGITYSPGGQLIVTQTPENQAKVQRLLDDLTAAKTRTIRIDATWLLLTHDEFQAMRLAPDKSSPELIELDGAALSKEKAVAHAHTLGLNGQTVHIASGTQHTFLSGVSAYGADSGASVSPSFTTILSGLSLQVRPTLLPSQHAMLLDVSSDVGDVASHADPIRLPGLTLPTTKPLPTTRPVPTPPGDWDFKFPHINGQHFQSTFKIPLGVDVAVAGMTQSPSSHADPPKQLYLVIRAEASQ